MPDVAVWSKEPCMPPKGLGLDIRASLPHNDEGCVAAQWPGGGGAKFDAREPPGALDPHGQGLPRVRARTT